MRRLPCSKAALAAITLAIAAALVSPFEPSPALADTTTRALTVTQLLTQKPFDRKVVITGVAKKGPLRCTLMECPDACCNSCGGSLLLADDKSQVTLERSKAVPEVGCSGKECSIKCKPLVPGKPYRIEGKLSRELRFQVLSYSTTR